MCDYKFSSEVDARWEQWGRAWANDFVARDSSSIASWFWEDIPES